MLSNVSEEEELIEDDTRDNAPAINLDSDSDDEPDNNNQWLRIFQYSSQYFRKW